MPRSMLTAALLLPLAACSVTADKGAAESGVAQFRRQMDAGQYRQIYAAATPEFRQNASEEAGVRFLQTVHDRLGAVRTAEQTGWRVNFASGGNVAALGYSTQFAHGRGTENFVFRIEGARARLMGYHVNSLDLVNPPAGASPVPAAPASNATR